MNAATSQVIDRRRPHRGRTFSPNESSREEIDLLRDRVDCAAVLENLPAPWRLDARESTRRALKYRRGEGEILIINHHGRGWWDPQSTAKGDVFALVQHLEPGLNFGQVRQLLRRFVGIAPTYAPGERPRADETPSQSPGQRWARRPALRHGDAAWCYLKERRGLPAPILLAASLQDVLRLGAFGSPWFAHREAGEVRHVEIRGPDFKGSLKGGHKSLFRLHGSDEPPKRLVITEAPIDALSIAAIEQLWPDTLYVATGGGMGPGTLQALQTLCDELASRPGASVESAADANAAGDRYARRHAEIAATAGVSFRRLRPPEGQDWNDVLRCGWAANAR
jgi:hypothetical protein